MCWSTPRSSNLVVGDAREPDAPAAGSGPIGGGYRSGVTVAHRTPRIDLTGPCLMLGESPARGVDVVVVDLTGVAAVDVADHLLAAEAAHPGGIGVRGGAPSAVGAALAAGVGLVVVDVATTDPREIAAVVEAGVVTVLHHADPARAVGGVDSLTAAGLDTSRVVVEVGPGAQLLEEVTVLERTAFGFRIGASVDLPIGSERWSHEVRAGWEIGTVVALLSAGVATVRGVDPERFRRVAATLGLIDAAAAGPDRGQAAPAAPGPAAPGDGREVRR